MGQAKQRGTFEERKKQAVKEGRKKKKKLNRKGIHELMAGYGAAENAITMALMAHMVHKRRTR